MFEWPFSFPIPFSADHGVDPEFELLPHELECASKYHFCYSESRYLAILNQSGHNKIPIRIQHPWITYRRSFYPTRKPIPDTCLVFPPHTTTKIAVDYTSTVKSFIDGCLMYILI